MSGSIGTTGATGPTEDAEAFAELLRGLKERSGLSYGALAKRLDMSTSTLHRYCNGSAVPTDYASVEQLTRVCRATAEELVELHRRWIVADAARARRRPGPNGTEPEATGPGGAGPEGMAPASTGSELRKPGKSNEQVVSGAAPSTPAHPRRRRTALIASVAAAAALGTVALTAGLAFSGGDDGDRTAVGDTTMATIASPTDDMSPSSSGSSSPSQLAKNGKPSAPTSAKATSQPVAEETPAQKATTLSPRQQANAASSQSSVLLKNAATGQCADIPGLGESGSVDGPVNQHPACIATSTDDMLWDLVVADRGGGPGEASLFIVRNVKDGLCMDLPDYGSVASQTKVTENLCNNTTSDNQLWYLDPRPNSTYWFRNLISNLCLDVYGGSSAGKNAQLQVVPCGDTATSAQRWFFS